jgi:hypothetical protein
MRGLRIAPFCAAVDIAKWAKVVKDANIKPE